MTVSKSKYYMLKVNYPDLAERIDNEPLFEEQVEEKLEIDKSTMKPVKTEA